MVDRSNEDLILLCLAESGATPDGDGTAVSVTDLSDVLDVGAETMAERVQLLSSLSALESDGKIAKHGADGDEVGYVLTTTGEAAAETLHDRLSDERIDVRRGGELETVDLDAADRFFDHAAVTRALARQSADGVLRLDDERGDRFIDRDEELERARSVVESVAGGECHTLLVAGKEGVGKTAFASEVEAAARDLNFASYDGTSRRDIDDPYGPFKQAIGAAIDGRDDVENPFDRGAVSLEDEDAYEAQRTALFFEVVEAIEAIGSEGPAFVLLDDLHWADAPTVDLLETVADHVEAPVLFVGTYRTEDLTEDHPLSALVDSWESDDRVTRIELTPFGRADTRRLVEWHLDTHDVPEFLVDILYDQTGGNALFVEESVKRLRADGRIDPDAGVYPDDAADIPVPDRVETAIDVRLDTLDETGTRILERIGVADGLVGIDVVAETIDVPPARVREYVDVLVDSRILERDGDRVRFVIDAIEETVRDRIDEECRQELHDLLATAIVELAEDPSERATDIAYHRERAGDPDEAIDRYLEAAEQAQAVYAHEVAVDRYERALELARERTRDETVLSVMESIAEVQFLSGDYESARRYFRYVQERTDDTDQRRRAARYRSNMAHEVGDADEAVRIAEAGLEDWDGETPDPEVCRLLIRKGMGLNTRGDPRDAEDVLKSALEMARAIGDDALIGRALHYVSYVAVQRGEVPDETEDRIQHEIEVLEGTGERRLRSKTYNNLAIAKLRKGNLTAAREAFERCLEIQETIGDEISATMTRGNLGIVHLQEGNVEAAERIYREAIESARRLGDRDTLGTAQHNLGDLSQRIGNLERATEYYERSLETYRGTDNEGSRLLMETELANHKYLLDDLEAALERVERVLEIAPEVSAYQHEYALGVLGRVRRELGDVDAAVDAHERGVEVADEVGANERIADSYRRLGETYIAADRIEAAVDALRTARDAVDEMADPWRTVQVLRAHGRGKFHAGDTEGAERDLREALSMARELNGRVEQGWSLYALGEFYRHEGDEARAHESFQEAQSIAADIGASLIERKARTALEATSAEQ